MLPRPSFVLPLVVALAACSGSVSESTEAAEGNAAGAANFGIGAGLIVEEKQVRETDSGAAVLSVDVRLKPPNYTVVYVKYSTADGSARAGEDYQPVEGTLRFEPGELVKTIEIPVLGDESAEGDEQFVLLLQLVSKSKTMETIKVSLTIQDDD